MSPALYQWGTINVEGEKANVLFGLKPDSGSDSIEDACDRECFDGSNDPIFKEGIKLIKDNLKSWQEKIIFPKIRLPTHGKKIWRIFKE